MITLFRRYQFSAIHSLEDEVDSDGRPLIHGHNYFLDVGLQGPTEEGSGWLVSRDLLDQKVTEVLQSKYDKKNLNKFIQPATAENLIQSLYKDLRDCLGPLPLKILRLHETRKNIFILKSSRTG